MPLEPFIQVIVPLRLEWEPYYRMEGASVGDRVRVVFGRKTYIGVVSAVNAAPVQTASGRILTAQKTELPPVSAQEIAFWRVLSSYYLCSVGEVYKAAYPSLKTEEDEVKVRSHKRLQQRLEVLQKKLEKARKAETRARYQAGIDRITAILKGENPPAPALDLALSPSREAAAEALRSAFREGRTALLQAASGTARTEIYLRLARETLSAGKSVLYLVPEIALSQRQEEQITKLFPGVLVYHSGRSAAQRREVADTLREGAPELVLGTRSALFLPFRELGLIIVDEEQDSSYKQDSPAPRYQARESAILLASVHGAQVLLGSSTPSLESLYNADTGLFTRVCLKESSSSSPLPETLLINTAAEARKKGMVGSFSLKLLEQMHARLDAGEKVLLVCRSKQAMPACSAEVEALFGAAAKGLVLATPASAKELPAESFGLAAVLQADTLLAREDFRCDERAHQVLGLLGGKCRPGGLLAIQTREDAHPVFGPYSEERTRQLLEERRRFGYPPYTRLIHVILRDQNGKRLAYMASELAGALRAVLPERLLVGPYEPAQQPDVRQLRLTLPRDRQLRQRKQALLLAVQSFEKERKYLGHIVLDVDPL